MKPSPMLYTYISYVNQSIILISSLITQVHDTPYLYLIHDLYHCVHKWGVNWI